MTDPQREREERESIARDVKRLEAVAAAWPSVETMIEKPDDPRTQAVRAQLGPSTLAQLEKITDGRIPRHRHEYHCWCGATAYEDI